MCDRAQIITTAKVILLAVNAVLCCILLFFADIYGRRAILQVASLTVVSGITVAWLFPNFYVRVVAMAVGLGAEGCFSGLFNIFINENTSKRL